MPCPARVLVCAAMGLALGCGANAGSRRPEQAHPPADKAALYGDPTLVPTREGEHARREVALAAEIEQAIEVLPSVAAARVDVELPPRSGPDEPRVLAVVRGAPGFAQIELSPQILTIAHAVMGADADVQVVLAASPTPSARAEPPLWPLGLGVLGLGFFAGVLLERARRLQRAIAARRRR